MNRGRDALPSGLDEIHRRCDIGNWNLNIQGVGCHHNNYPKDADRMARRFVAELIDAGHAVEVAAFTAGSKTDLAPTVGEPKPTS